MTKTSFVKVGAYVLILFLTFTSWSVAAVLPKLSGYVNDYAGIISPAKKIDLENRIKNFEQSDSPQIIIVTIPSLEGESIEDFSKKVAESWKVEQKGNDKSVFFIVAKQERKVRIEVTRALEDRITDLTAGQLIRQVITPKFESGDFDGGFVAGTLSLIEAYRGTYRSEVKTSSPHNTNQLFQSPKHKEGTMFGMGAPELIVVAVVAFVVVVGFSRKGGKARISGPSLVLTRFSLDESASGNPIVAIEGRASGLIVWLLTILGLDATTTLTITNNDVSFRSSSLFGEMYQVAPLSCVSSTHCGFFKPIGYLIIGILIALGGVVAGLGQHTVEMAWLTLIVAGLVFIVAYFLSKKLAISLETTGGMLMGLKFKKSVIENVSVDIQKANVAIQLINRKVIEAQTKSA